MSDSETPLTDREVKSHRFDTPRNRLKYMTYFAMRRERELAAAKSELEQFKKREREFPDHHSQDISPELRTW